jgi:hypothetical protein
MTSADAIIQAESDKIEAEIQWAVEMGGLPTEAEVAEGIATSAAGNDLPFDITLEQIGAVATLTSDVEIGLETLTKLHERAGSQIFSLSAIRAEQQSSKRGGADA